jgi:hypothetical protein
MTLLLDAEAKTPCGVVPGLTPGGADPRPYCLPTHLVKELVQTVRCSLCIFAGKSVGHELADQVGGVDLPVVGEDVGLAEDHFGAGIQIDGEGTEIQRDGV